MYPDQKQWRAFQIEELIIKQLLHNWMKGEPRKRNTGVSLLKGNGNNLKNGWREKLKTAQIGLRLNKTIQVWKE